MVDGKRESAPKRWLKSAKSLFKDDGKSLSSHSEGKTSGVSSVTTTASGSVRYLPSRPPANNLTSTGLAIIPEAALITLEQPLLPGREQAAAPDNVPNTLNSAVSSSAHTAAGEPLEVLSTHNFSQNTPVLQNGIFHSLRILNVANSSIESESSNLVSKSSSPTTEREESQSNILKDPHPTTTNLAAPVSPSHPDPDIPASIHVTIGEIQNAQRVLQEKKWYYTDRNGKQVDVRDRVERILRSVEECAKIVDIAIQHHPQISTLVWAGARFILMVGHMWIY